MQAEKDYYGALGEKMEALQFDLSQQGRQLAVSIMNKSPDQQAIRRKEWLQKLWTNPTFSPRAQGISPKEAEIRRQILIKQEREIIDTVNRSALESERQRIIVNAQNRMSDAINKIAIGEAEGGYSLEQGLRTVIYAADSLMDHVPYSEWDNAIKSGMSAAVNSHNSFLLTTALKAAEPDGTIDMRTLIGTDEELGKDEDGNEITIPASSGILDAIDEGRGALQAILQKSHPNDSTRNSLMMDDYNASVELGRAQIIEKVQAFNYGKYQTTAGEAQLLDNNGGYGAAENIREGMRTRALAEYKNGNISLDQFLKAQKMLEPVTETDRGLNSKTVDKWANEWYDTIQAEFDGGAVDISAAYDNMVSRIETSGWKKPDGKPLSKNEIDWMVTDSMLRSITKNMKESGPVADQFLKMETDVRENLKIELNGKVPAEKQAAYNELLRTVNMAAIREMIQGGDKKDLENRMVNIQAELLKNSKDIMDMNTGAEKTITKISNQEIMPTYDNANARKKMNMFSDIMEKGNNTNIMDILADESMDATANITVNSVKRDIQRKFNLSDDEIKNMTVLPGQKSGGAIMEFKVENNGDYDVYTITKEGTQFFATVMPAWGDNQLSRIQLFTTPK
ncbi:MAG: hypothetical protein LBB22_03610 [Treponema sp.]|jgi:hypothetical protein|nr:hypothetical protein [Treponema sp.]